MKLFKAIFAIALLVGAYFVVSGDAGGLTGFAALSTDEPSTVATNPNNLDEITIANWNIQVFGQSKWEDKEVRDRIIDIVEEYDIVVIQEIRDASGEVFDELCISLPDHDCVVSERAGRTDSKEQYGVIYAEGITVKDTTDHSMRLSNYKWFERPPYEVEFAIGEYEFTLLTIHIKPDDVDNELKYLEGIAQDIDGNLIILGDLNADGSYYDEDSNDYFIDYKWVIDNDADTTVAKSDNTYDRILLSQDMAAEYKDHGVYNDITEDVSDHYLVWVSIIPFEEGMEVALAEGMNTTNSTNASKEGFFGGLSLFGKEAATGTAGKSGTTDRVGEAIDEDGRIIPGTYLHYKNNDEYEVLGEATHETTGATYIIYRPLFAMDGKDLPDYWVLAKDEFLENIEVDGQIVPRFRKK